MQSPQFFSAIQLNNVAASSLRNGDFDGAITSLSSAFRMSKASFDREPGQLEAPAAYTIDDFMQYQACDLDSEEKESYVYQRAIPIPPLPSLVEAKSYGSKVTVLSIVIFNLALAHHLASMHGQQQQPEPRYFLLQKATKLYELGYKLQKSNQRPSRLYSMAILNNLGQAHRAMNEEDKAQQCFSHLLSALMFLIDQGDFNFTSVDVFFQTTSHLILNTNSAAAPAA